MLIESPKVQGLIEVRIHEHKPIAHNQWIITLKAERELPEFLAGQFCMLSFLDAVDPITPRPFAIVERREGMYQFIYRVVGKFTRALARMPLGTRIGLLGPLGRGFELKNFQAEKSVFIAGGVGFASLMPLLDYVHRLNQEPLAVFYGVRTDLEIIRRSTFKTFYSSDDGSSGFRGRVTDLMHKHKDLWKEARAFYVCGPTPMMKAVWDLLPSEKSFYFLEETMGCGIGICIGCVVPIESEKGEIKRVRSCMEGSVFRGDRLRPWREGAWQT